MPYPGPYTQLSVGQTGVRGRVFIVFAKVMGGVIQADGDFPESSVAPIPTALQIGRFPYTGYQLQQGAEITFDIIQNEWELGPRATNITQV